MRTKNTDFFQRNTENSIVGSVGILGASVKENSLTDISIGYQV